MDDIRLVEANVTIVFSQQGLEESYYRRTDTGEKPADWFIREVIAELNEAMDNVSKRLGISLEPIVNAKELE